MVDVFFEAMIEDDSWFWLHSRSDKLALTNAKSMPTILIIYFSVLWKLKSAMLPY
jgi:hypothetical protein